jgi:DNA-binding IclR family transcriptional regulator
MLEYVPVRFDLYRPLKPCLRWTLQCLVAFADRTGKCWPSVRKLAEVAGLSKSTAARHLSALAIAGVVTRKRLPGGVYRYVIDGRFLPASRGVSHSAEHAVPPAPDRRKLHQENLAIMTIL